MAQDRIRWRFKGGELLLGGKPLVMGIVNATPDSFWAPSRAGGADEALRRALTLVEEGADLIDVGGESTRPGAGRVDPEEEASRVVPLIAALSRRCPVPISVDTSRADVARRALAAGAQIVNDVTALSDPAMGQVVAGTGAGLILMHTRGDSATMAGLATYRSVMGEVLAELTSAMGRVLAAGVEEDRVVIDPGIGFAKQGVDNLTVLRHLPVLASLGRPILVGASRKSFLEKCFGHLIEERLEGSLAAVAAAMSGGAAVVRVHDVASTRRFIDVLWAIENAPTGEVDPS